jgi:hypothetical protein
MATADVQEIRATSYVGFDSITQQIEHKLLKRGFQFNVIVVGTSSSLSVSYAFQGAYVPQAIFNLPYSVF